MSEGEKKDVVGVIPMDPFAAAIIDELWANRVADWMRLTDDGMSSGEAWDLAGGWMDGALHAPRWSNGVRDGHALVAHRFERRGAR